MEKLKKSLITQEQFERKVKERVVQLKRSKIWKDKTALELNDVHTPEEAKEYIKKAGKISLEEKKQENLELHNAKR